MRARFLLPTLTLAAVIAVGVLWLRERAAAKSLQDRGATLAQREQALAHLQAEQQRLHQEVEDARRRASAESGLPVSGEPSVSSEPPAAPAWVTGEWTPAAAWRNAGQTTPQATASTLLWAAANGDLATMRTIFQFDDNTRAKARAWFDSLPPTARLLHATPEDLVAGVTLASISSDRAQLSWLHQGTDDRAIVGLLVAGSPAASAPPVPDAKAVPDKRPPALADHARYKLVVLSLQRASDGWRVQVPADAIDNLARNLRAADAR